MQARSGFPGATFPAAVRMVDPRMEPDPLWADALSESTLASWYLAAGDFANYRLVLDVVITTLTCRALLAPRAGGPEPC
jgi:hypothetical protein